MGVVSKILNLLTFIEGSVIRNNFFMTSSSYKY